jgi:hypothetical protein
VLAISSQKGRHPAPHVARYLAIGRVNEPYKQSKTRESLLRVRGYKYREEAPPGVSIPTIRLAVFRVAFAYVNININIE